MARSKTTTAAAQQAAAANWQVSAGHYAQYPNAAGPGNFNIGGALGGPWQPSIQPISFPNYTITTTDGRTAIELLEELVGIVRQLEDRLSLDPKDKSKHAFLEMIMGRIQEDVINETIQRLKALKI